PLLDVSASVRDRFRVQAQQCPSNWLIAGMDVTQQADLQFKSARNQRLHVEFTLLKLCMLQQGGIEKPATAVPTAAPAIVKPAAAATASPATPPTAAAATAIPKPPAPPPPPASKAAPTRLAKISLNPEKDSEKKNDGPVETKAQELPRQRFSPVQFQKLWNDYAKQINEQGRYAIAAAMTKRQPEQQSEENYLFVVDSPAVEKDLNEMKPDLLGHIRHSL
ncbi:MAG: hypothetical protein ACKO7B_09435, partial [Flavobacteriales bacterium]